MVDQPPTPTGNDAVAPDVLRPAAVAAHLEALNLAGVGFAARRLLGKDPGPVAKQFHMWGRQDLEDLPSLTEGFWAALRPLRIGQPQLAAAAACDMVLQGRERDAVEAAAAAAQCAAAGRTLFKRAPLLLEDAAGTEHGDACVALVDAVKDYWRALGTVYGEVRPRVLSGDHDRAVRMLGKAGTLLADMIARVHALATTVAGPQPAAAPDPFAQRPILTREEQAAAVDPVRQPTSASTPEALSPAAAQPTGPLGDPTMVEGRAEAFARSQPVRAEPEVTRRPVEVLSTKPVRNHRVLPVLFILSVAGLALFVIFRVLNAPNPLTP